MPYIKFATSFILILNRRVPDTFEHVTDEEYKNYRDKYRDK